MIPLYRYSAETAKHNSELDTWRESKKENIRCRDFLDEQIAKRFDGFTLPSDCVKNTVKEFGYDRTMWVIANTIQNRKGDGRFHSRNTEWAKRFNIPDTGRNYEFAMKSHSCLVDGAADDIRKMYSELNLLSVEHIVRSDESQDYENKLLIVRDICLKEEYRTPENQLFFATGGFGCSPTASGRKVFGYFLSDGEKAEFCRQDFIGAIADEHIPDWAREKLEQLNQEHEQSQDNSPEMKM
ncbi:MAG: DUF3849 domain-containing protein [Oscillospiraceae bacterium]|nr:DUF3849 domain-containing protein [Oscillospiraceae bacterium]